MTLNDLETGMVVETRNGNRWLVVNGIILDRNEYMRLDKYQKDMTLYKELSSEFDIIKVWKLERLCNMPTMLDKHSDWLSEDRFGHLIYDREAEEIVDMTMEEVCAALGKQVRIIESKKE